MSYIGRQIYRCLGGNHIRQYLNQMIPNRMIPIPMIPIPMIPILIPMTLIPMTPNSMIHNQGLNQGKIDYIGHLV